MAHNLKIEDVFIQIRDKLHKDGVKLWLPPYFIKDRGVCDDELKVLSNDYSASLKLPYDSCYAAISELQSNALEKLKQRDRFRDSGLATVKVKVLHGGFSKLLTKEVALTINAAEFKNIISKEVSATDDRIKLICGGRVIRDDDTLQNQSVQNGSLILALVLSETPGNIIENEKQIKELQNIKADASLLATDDGDYMQLEDQAGNAIHIPASERKALMIGMTLQEKGKYALKQENYAKALVYFLDADQEFSRCNSKLFECVDNYALLNLDIAWCYLCLQSVSHLPEAYERLRKCEERFHKSYGTNLERLIALKGSPGNEAVLFMRLHLLQGIILFHQNKREEAMRLLKQAEAELNTLKVDEESLIILSELGYSTAEARLGLRATRGDVNLAANYINTNREIRAQSRKKAMMDRILERKKKKLGKCVDGEQYVNPDFLKMLVSMGYNREVARLALQNTNNIISDAIQYMQEHPLPGPSGSRSEEMLGFIEDLIPELEAAGFDYHMAKLALQKHAGDIMKAAEDLLEHGGVIEEDSSSSSEEDEEMRGKKERERERKEEALQRLAQDMSMVDDDHLDLTLQQEEVFLRQYLSLLETK